MTDRFEYEVTEFEMNPLVYVTMGSQSDWESTMRHTCVVLNKLEIQFMVGIDSAHRTPDRLHEKSGMVVNTSVKVVIAGAGGAAHLPGMFAGKTPLPVIGVPVQSKALSGVDSLYSIVQMPPSTPVGTMAIGKSGAFNAAMFAAAIIGTSDMSVQGRLIQYRAVLRDNVPERPVDESEKRT